MPGKRPRAIDHLAAIYRRGFDDALEKVAHYIASHRALGCYTGGKIAAQIRSMKEVSTCHVAMVSDRPFDRRKP